YLVVPDGPVPVVNRRGGAERPHVSFDAPGMPPPALRGLASGAGGTNAPLPVADFAREVQKDPGKGGEKRSKLADEELRKEGNGKDDKAKAVRDALELKTASEGALSRLRSGDLGSVQAGKLGVDLSVYSAQLRGQQRLSRTAVRHVWGRNCLEIGGVWIDEGFTAKTPTLVVKAQSDAYFKLLERQPKLKEVFKLGNYLVWVAPGGTALVIDTAKGKDTLSDTEIDKLFTVKK
ncbi:MAG TPA: hypothetical protein VH575_33785, partial [Gemmataceae bacterium]